MGSPDVVDLAERALGLPKFADPTSRRRGVLQYTRNELRRRERETAARLADLRVALEACERELAVLEAGAAP
jgi:hypothetical protein